jgi:antitoxin VapB
METKKRGNSQRTEAKLFWNGRSQAVRLPKEFRFEGDRVNIRRVDGGVLLESKPNVRHTEESIRQWFAEIDAIVCDEPFPERAPQNLAPIREYFD